MLRPLRAVTFVLLLSASLGSAPAWAQGPAEDAGTPSAAASRAPVATAPEASTRPTDDRPAQGPALRDRGARRSRAGSSATGALFLFVLVGSLGYYIVKKLRRYR